MNAYSFLPWLRRGIATLISEDPGTAARASVQVKLRLSGPAVAGSGTVAKEVSHDVALYGPGDVIGVDPRAIVRTEPRNWITNFDPNFLAFIEFYDEDFPWRYSPAAADPTTKRLRPWLAVVVLTEAEFNEVAAQPGRPLPMIQIDELGLLPPADELGAWAHVHVNRGVTASDSETVSDDMEAVLPRLSAVLDENPDLACSRLMCPRRLDASAMYHAFLVPAFETGRLAGLGLDPAGSPGALHSSWAGYSGRPEPGHLCFYHRWQFRTAPAGDFEFLVRLLKPRTVDARVGNRDIDVQHPGAGLPGITNPDLGGVLRLGGALKVPDTALDPTESAEAQKFEDWDQPYQPYPHPFQQALAALINLSDGYAVEPVLAANGKAAAAGVTSVTPDDPDPMVTPPLYGRWPALTSRLLTERDGKQIQPNTNWVHELNLDPRFRVAAGIGARVVREHQEEFMAAAWAQLGDVLEANRRIRAAQLAREVGYAFHTRQLQPLMQTAPAQALAVTAPLHTRVVAPVATAAARAAAASGSGTKRLTVAAQLADSRIVGTPLSPPMRRVTRPGSRLMRALPFDLKKPRHALLERINRGEVTAAPPKTRPAGVVTVDQLEAALRERPDAPAPKGSTAELAAIPDPVADLPQSPTFVVSLPGEDVHPEVGDTDSPEANRFKTGLHDVYTAFNVADQAGQVPPREQMELGALAGATLAGLHPDVTVPRRVLGGLALPERFRPQADRFVEAMAYPVIDLPMYRPLVEMSRELFLPNLNLVPPNSITLLEANQRFIESYMVGLNHEMARELLWREYPTDQRGSPFRQFWDPRSVLPKPGETPDEQRERLRDIPPLHRWKKSDALGDHDAHDQDGGADLVLVIRGELLKKYPTAVIYAHRAEWQRNPDNSIDPTRPRRRTDLPPDEANPPHDKVRMPVFDAKVDPDIYFFGFDLTEEAARGGTGEDPNDDAGWFFIIKERPGDPRFGLDLERTGKLEVWNDLAWPDVLPAGAAPPGPTYLRLDAGTPTLKLTAPGPGEDQGKHDQHAEDQALIWNPEMSASDTAYILYQAPVLMAVHAREMLDDD